jgi:hypothetical protein
MKNRFKSFESGWAYVYRHCDVDAWQDIYVVTAGGGVGQE